MEPKDHLVVALDSVGEAHPLELVDELGALIDWYKVGHATLSNYPNIVNSLITRGKKVFVDLKIDDIQTIVSKAAYGWASRGAAALTIKINDSDASYPTLAEVVKTVEGSNMMILAVSRLTSRPTVDDFPFDAQKFHDTGCQGAVVPPVFLPKAKEVLGERVVVLTPGVRIGTSSNHEHNSVISPMNAFLKGADVIVMGRPIYEDKYPRSIVENVMIDIQEAYRA